ncbi:MAG: PqqD family protein [Okeania sp. SIO2D1]|uniref:PqqD family protein n=1 Tax=Okeania sp. SIO2C9 TaxID=2607791 RepID=UPI0013BB5F42|nr:PqqD family protein [Okeania sp. SIO2C9]NEQ74677.1 PqqD family protein [Okeania sp. SIO2C9]NES65538.1 PqqD family protein [Okeania sp. SIO2D1]
MRIILTQQVLLTDNFFLAEDEGEIFLVNSQQEGQDFILDDMAAKMLFALIGSGSIQEAYEDLLQEEQVEPEVLKNDLLEYIRDLRNDGIVKIIDEQDNLSIVQKG